MPVTIAAHLAHDGRQQLKAKPIDRCIAPLVAALEEAGILMLGSCCGHGKGDGEILLADGRSLVVRERTG